jgi:hypothetical protein
MGRAAMKNRHVMSRPATLALKAVAWVLAGWLAVSPAAAVELKSRTVEAFDHYVRLSEARMDTESAGGAPFLWVDRLPQELRGSAYAELKQGKIVIERLETFEDGKPIPVPGGLIHHWIGTAFIPGVTLDRALALVEDYDHHQDYYRPDVMRSKILRHTGNDFLVYLRFYKKKVLTSVLDTEHEVHYTLVDSTHASSQSRTTSIREVENPGESDERLRPLGDDRGFLWRMNTYWRFEEKDGGTYVESQSISLTRNIPGGLSWLVRPFVESVPRETLTFTLSTTRATLVPRTQP